MTWLFALVFSGIVRVTQTRQTGFTAFLSHVSSPQIWSGQMCFSKEFSFLFLFFLNLIWSLCGECLFPQSWWSQNTRRSRTTTLDELRVTNLFHLSVSLPSWGLWVGRTAGAPLSSSPRRSDFITKGRRSACEQEKVASLRTALTGAVLRY